MATLKAAEDFKVLIVYPNLPLMLIPSIAVALFTDIFKKRGYQVKLFETTYYMSDEATNTKARVERLQARRFDVVKELQIVIKNDMLGDFRRMVEEYQPDLLVISTVEDTFLQAVKMLNAVQDLKIPHIVGGVFPTHAKDRCFDFPEINMIGLGEGEVIVNMVAEAVRQGAPLHNIPGTWYRDPSGQIHKNPAPPLADINKVRPDFSLFEDKRFYRPMGGRLFKMIPIETYRGCPYSCTYCNSPAMTSFARDAGQGKFLRRKSMDILRAEIKYYVDNFNPEFFYIMDDSFLARPKQEIFDFCDMYEEFKLPFWFNTRAENCHPEVMARLKEVNCYRMAASCECGNDDYRRSVLRRNIDNDKLIRHFNDIADSGIAFSVDIMVGLPGETRELVMESVDLIRQIRGYDALTVSVFTPYHGTVLREVAIKNGWLDGKTVCSGATTTSLLTMPPPYLGSEEIVNLTSVLPMYCYFPKEEWDTIRRAETPDDEGLRLRQHYAERYNREFFGNNQEDKQTTQHVGGAGCRSNPRDSFQLVPTRLSEDELARLMLPAMR